jgi:hypothetical protein
MMSCSISTKSTSSNSKNEHEEQNDEQNKITNTIVQLTLLELEQNAQYKGYHDCNCQNCDALVTIEKLVKQGFDYHGQIRENDTLNVHFIFSHQPDTAKYPLLKKHPLTSLEKNMKIEAETFEKRTQFSVEFYKTLR